MAIRIPWTESSIVDGVLTVTFAQSRSYFEYIQTEMLDYKTYIFRGQRDSSWELRSSLSRKLIDLARKETPQFYTSYLKKFKYASRGRTSSSIDSYSDFEWWALGQHHGLATPLLDWTDSAFVALFFAFESPELSGTGFRTVCSVSKGELSKIKKSRIARGEKNVVDIVQPLTGDNARLVNQRGLFTFQPEGIEIEEYVRSECAGNDSDVVLIKMLVPQDDQEHLLKFLNTMNINHLTLFPDLQGASRFVNMGLDINRY